VELYYILPSKSLFPPVVLKSIVFVVFAYNSIEEDLYVSMLFI
jgi:hypothetical protein